jgi:N-acetylgalactosamine kinase
MSITSSRSTSGTDHRSRALASELRSEFLHPHSALSDRLTSVYRDPLVCRERAAAAVGVLNRFLEAFGDAPCALYRAPARLSLNPHTDHQGAWVPYGLHVRELLGVVAAADEGFEIVNTDPSFAPRLAFSPAEEIGRAPAAWREGWLPYLESPGVTESVRANLDAKSQTRERRGTLNYVKSAALRLRQAFPQAELPGLRMALSGNIAQGGGQSSSSALVVVTALATRELGNLPIRRRELAEACGEAEWYVGTRGGSGDHAAILLGSQEGLVHLCFRAPVGIRDVRYSPFPAGYQLVVANSQTRSEKSAEERLLFNRGIFAYRFAFLALKEQMRALGLPPELIGATESLGDLHTGRVSASDLYRLLLSLPVSITPRELATRFPQTFSAAARGCFGTDDPTRLPAEIPLRGAAVYGLGRVDRGQVMPELLEAGGEAAMREFGRLMDVTHDGDRLFRGEQPYVESRDRLCDQALLGRLADCQQGQPRPLREEPGFYGASIAELDRMVDVTQQVDGVLGAGLMGAGGGGYILILARDGSLERIRTALQREYYHPLGKEPDVEAWQPAPAASRLA